MDYVPDHLFISVLVEDLRKQKTRMWVRTLILSIILGLFAICALVFAVLYATKTCAVPSPSTETPIAESPTVTVSETVSGTVTITATPDATPFPSTLWEPVTVWSSIGKTFSLDAEETEPLTETLTPTKFSTVRSTLLHTKTVTKEIVTTATATAMNMATKTVTETSMATTTTTRTETSMATTTSVSTMTVTASGQLGSGHVESGQLGPTRACPAGLTIGGQRLLEFDRDYYFGLINLTLRNQPNSKGTAHSNQDIIDIAGSSLWRCGDNGWIVYESYCEKGVTRSSGEKKTDTCVSPVPNVPQSRLSHA